MNALSTDRGTCRTCWRLMSEARSGPRPGLDSAAVEVSGDGGGEFFGVAERGEVTTRHDERVDTKAFSGDALLELEREEPVLTAGHDVDRGRGPGVERADVVESFIELGLGVLRISSARSSGMSCMK